MRVITFSRRSGKCRASHSSKSSFTPCGRRSTTRPACPAPAAAARLEDLRDLVVGEARGSIGATITPTGTPAFASRSIAARRLPGGAARGSMLRCSSASRLVIESATDAAPCEASSREEVDVARHQ